MLTSFASYFATRKTSIKGQKLVSEVVEHSEKENGLVRIRTRDLHDDWPKEALPWVQMKGGFGSGNNQGTTDETKQIPPVGSKVYTEFEDDSQYHGVYHGGPASDDKKNTEFTGKENYGKTYGKVDPAGNLFKVRTEEGKEDITHQHVSGTSHNMDKDGGYNISAMKGVNLGGESGTFKFDKNGTLEFGGDLVIKSGGKVTFEGKSMEFKHGGATSTTPITPGAGGPSSPSSRTKPVKRSRPQFKSPGMKV